MKVLRLCFLFVFLPIFVTPTAAQFNSVEKIIVRARIVSSGEYSQQGIFKNEGINRKEERSSSKSEDKNQQGNENRYKEPTLREYINDRTSIGPNESQGNSTNKKEPTKHMLGASVSARLIFSYPLEHGKLVVTSPYGYRKDPITHKRKFHRGTDFRTATENVYAMMPGRIKRIGYDKHLGNYIRLEHGDWEVTYGHLFTVRGKKGDWVEAGHSVGISGSTGRSTGEHLHVSIKHKGNYVDPYPIIKYIADQAKGGKSSGKR